MKKRDWKSILLIVFSAAAIVLACMPNSVTVYTALPSGEPVTAKCSYLTLVEDVKGSIALPAAVLVAGITLVLASICVSLKKKKLLPAIKVIALLGAILAVVPILVRTENVTMVPNVLVPIFLLAVFFDVYAILGKNTEKGDKPRGKSL